MEQELRGSVEKFIDGVITDNEILERAVTTLKSLMPMSNTEDVVCGYLIGRILEWAFEKISVSYNRAPTNQEWADVLAILERRVLRMRSQVRLSADR